MAARGNTPANEPEDATREAAESYLVDAGVVDQDVVESLTDDQIRDGLDYAQRVDIQEQLTALMDSEDVDPLTRIEAHDAYWNSVVSDPLATEAEHDLAQQQLDDLDRLADEITDMQDGADLLDEARGGGIASRIDDRFSDFLADAADPEELLPGYGNDNNPLSGPNLGNTGRPGSDGDGSGGSTGVAPPGTGPDTQGSGGSVDARPDTTDPAGDLLGDGGGGSSGGSGGSGGSAGGTGDGAGSVGGSGGPPSSVLPTSIHAEDADGSTMDFVMGDDGETYYRTEGSSVWLHSPGASVPDPDTDQPAADQDYVQQQYELAETKHDEADHGEGSAPTESTGGPDGGVPDWVDPELKAEWAEELEQDTHYQEISMRARMNAEVQPADHDSSSAPPSTAPGNPHGPDFEPEDLPIGGGATPGVPADGAIDWGPDHTYGSADGPRTDPLAEHQGTIGGSPYADHDHGGSETRDEPVDHFDDGRDDADAPGTIGNSLELIDPADPDHWFGRGAPEGREQPADPGGPGDEPPAAPEAEPEPFDHGSFEPETPLGLEAEPPDTAPIDPYDPVDDHRADTVDDGVGE